MNRRARAAALPPDTVVPASLAGTMRVPVVDLLRGGAIVAMIAYHFCFDLAYFRLASFDFYRDPWWLHARTAILTSFLLLAGGSLVLAERTAGGRSRFWRHVLLISACAVAVSLASYLIFPRSYIWFGVLHAIAVSLVLIRPLASHPWIALGSGVAVIVAGLAWRSPWFDDRAWGWVGFVTAKPVTEDYVPLFPWTGVMLVGAALAHYLPRSWLRPREPAARGRILRWLGRHSLAVYMLHQPLLIGALFLVTRR